MVNKTVVRVMDACGEWFAVLYEQVRGVTTDGATVKGAFKGNYSSGMMLRIHGAHDSAFDYVSAGSVYEVQEYANGVLTLDRPLHTFAPNLLIAALEVPQEFKDVCSEIETWEERFAKQRGLASESIDGYSWSAASASNGDTGFLAAFADELKQYRSSKPTQLYYLRRAREWR